MSRLVRFAIDSGTLNDQSESTKAEILLVAKRVGCQRIDDLTFTNPIYQAIAHYYKPSVYSKPDLSLVDTTYETEFCKRLIGDSYNPDYYYPYLLDDLSFAMHQVFFDTNFGETRRNDPALAGLILDNCRKNFWEKEGQFSIIQYMDWLAQCGLALRCLNTELPDDLRDLLYDMNFLEITWDNYHSFVSFEFYLSLSI